MAKHMNKLAELAAESRRALVTMDNLRNQLNDANASGQPNAAILNQMEATSRRYRELTEQMYKEDR